MLTFKSLHNSGECYHSFNSVCRGYVNIFLKEVHVLVQHKGGLSPGCYAVPSTAGVWVVPCVVPWPLCCDEKRSPRPDLGCRLLMSKYACVSTLLMPKNVSNPPTYVR